MEKIKSVLSGHKKDNATHDTHTSSTGAHHAGGEHPIYNEMAGSSTAQPATIGTSTSAGQTGTSAGLGQTEKTGTPAPSGVHSAHVSDNSPSGARHSFDALSGASIKSGVIGFGGGHQGHAALSSHQTEANQPGLDHKQVLGGGSTAPGPRVSDTSEQPSTLNSAIPLSGTSTIDQSRSHIGSTGLPGDTTHSSTTRQPFDQTMRQESYTNDTDRSFPLIGGIASKHDPSASHHSTTTAPTTQQTTSTHPTHHAITSEREPGTKEKEVGVHDGHGREALAGAAAAATTVGATAPLLHSKNANDRSLESREAPLASSTGHSTQSHNPDALAAATAAVAKSSATPSSAPTAHQTSLAGATRAHESSSTAEPEDSRYTDPGRPPGGRKLSYRHVPGGYPSPTPDESKTFLFYRDQIVPEPGAPGPVVDHVPSKRHSGHHEAHHSPELSKAAPLAAAGAGGLAGGLAGSHFAGEKSTAGPHQSDTLNKLDPKVDSDLDGSSVARDTPSSQRDIGLTGNPAVAGANTSTLDQHELRHTGSLEQPTPRSSEHADDHHYGRDAAVAGGLGAGAAGLGYAATHKRDKSPDVAHGALPEETSPYSSRQLDPRVLGSQGKLDEQKFDPQSRSEPSSHHNVPAAAAAAPVAAAATTTHEHRSGPTEVEKSSTGPHKSSLLNKLDPRVKNDNTETTEKPSKVDESKDHHGRDAALIGGGAATAAGVHHSLQRNDTPGTGTAVVPGEQRTPVAQPLSSTTTRDSHPVTGTSVPVSETTSSIPVSEQDNKTSAHLPTSGYAPPHPAATKKYEPYQGPMTTEGSPFYGTVGAPAPIVEGQSTSLSKQDDDHHHGRDAALAGAGATTVGGLAYASQKDHKTDTGPASTTLHNVGSTTEDPASRTIGPHSSNVANVLDPRVQPDPSKQKGHTTTGPHQSDTLNRADPRVDEKAAQHDKHHLGRDAAIAGGAGAAGYGAYEAVNAYGDHRSTQPNAAMSEQRYDTTASAARAPNPVPAAGHYDYNNDHTSRNAALGTGAGLGAGALGGAAYAGSKHADYTQAPGTATDSPVHPTQGTLAPQNTHTGVTGMSHAPHDSVQDPIEKDHSKRNAAIAGTAGVAAAGGAAYAHNDKEQQKLEKEREKEAHKLEKEREKEAHKLEKEREKEARRHSKELEKETSTPEKKHGILGFLHRDKSKKDRSSADTSPRHSGEVRRSVDHKRHSKEYAAGGAALGAGAAATAYDDDSSNPESPRWKGKHLLRKEPPKGHPAREAMEHHEMGEMPGKHEHIGVDGPIGNANAISGVHQTQHNTYGAEPLSEGLGQGNDKVIEPHTGLPMNVGRYGDGHGGTDANPSVHGHHEGADAHAVDWNAVKKANTPY
ncbi:hypothetical protein DE146DRAFT_778339 [Phaeosphaeria sp. MPI-PUGE-AT-0046c]|nr:hypothetical protein DE146DRAFT_778339 [Phaeosphaeria sp. MPI-PUGE-AT-0046c]